MFFRYLFARPSGKRCFVVSNNGTTVSRLRNGSMLHRFPSALPNGAKKKDVTGSAQSYSILDCIFHESEWRPGCLLRFAIGEAGVVFVDGKLEKADLHYLGKVNGARAFAHSFSKVMFQYNARHSPLRIDDLLGSVNSPIDQETKRCDIEMDG